MLKTKKIKIGTRKKILFSCLKKISPFFVVFILLLSASMVNAEVFWFKWGSTGTGDGEFSGPRGVAIDSSERVYVVETSNCRVQKFTSHGTFITKWGSCGNGDGQFNNPHYVAIDSTGNVYVSDTENHRIQKFTHDGIFITKWGSFGTRDGEFDEPRGLAFDAADNFYVADSLNDRVQKFTKDGVFITKWGSSGSADGQMKFPEGIAVDSSNNIYVGEFWGDRVQKFTKDGVFITKWGSSGSGDGEFNGSEDVAVDCSDNVYVGDHFNNRVQKFTSEGEFITKWGSSGSGDGEFNWLGGIAISSSCDAYVSDEGLDRVQVFGAKRNRFVVMADSRDNDCDSSTPQGARDCINAAVLQQVMTSVKGLCPAPAFILFGGDMAYGYKNKIKVRTELDAWRSIIDEVMSPDANDPNDPSDSSVPVLSYTNNKIYPVFGGHERVTEGFDAVWSAFDEVFFLDPNVDQRALPRTYFSDDDQYTTDLGRTVYYFDYPSQNQKARFFVLNNDTMVHELGDDQLDWLSNNLNSNGMPLNFFFHHEAAYGTGAHNDDNIPRAMDRKPVKRNQYIELLGNNAKTMIFSGHEHQYTRRLINETFAKLPINNPTADAISFSGSFYEVKTGTCGAPIYPGYMPPYTQPDYVFGPVTEFHFAVVDVFNETVTVTVHAVDGDIIDSFFYGTGLFEDVPPGYWAEDYIYVIYDAEITKGCFQNPLKYCPFDLVTRAEMAAFIVRAKEGEPPANYCDTGSPFSDVPANTWPCKYIKRLLELEITKGCGPGIYCPDAPVTRAEMAAFIIRAIEGEPPANYCDTGSPFSDVPANTWPCKYIKRLLEMEITKGCGPGIYCPDRNVTRAEMAAFLARAFLGME